MKSAVALARRIWASQAAVSGPPIRSPMGRPRNWSAIEKFGIEQTPLVGLDGLVEVVDQPRHTFRRRLTLDPEVDAGPRPAAPIAGFAEIEPARVGGL